MTITKDMSIGEVVGANVELAPLLAAVGMHCFGCPMAQMESIEQACAGHGVDVDDLVRRLNEKLAALQK